MADPFDDGEHYGFYHTNTDISQGTANYIRLGKLNLSVLQQVGLLNKIDTGSTAPTDSDALWLDQSTDPAVLKQLYGTSWIPVTQERIFGPVGQLTEVLAYQSAPPVSPATGDRYLVLSTGTGAWATHDEELAEFIGGAWAFENVPLGKAVINKATGAMYLGTDGTVLQVATSSGGGSLVFAAAAAPVVGEGSNGDYALGTDGTLWGPKSGGAWPGTSMSAGAFIMQGKFIDPIWASAWKPTTTSGCAALATTEISSEHEYQSLDFDGAADEKAWVRYLPPKNWNGGTIRFRVEWTSSATDTDGVAWFLQGASLTDGDANALAYGTAVISSDAAQSTANDHYLSAWSATVTIAGAAAGEPLKLLIYRDVSDAADTMTEDAKLVRVDIEFTVNAADES